MLAQLLALNQQVAGKGDEKEKVNGGEQVVTRGAQVVESATHGVLLLGWAKRVHGFINDGWRI